MRSFLSILVLATSLTIQTTAQTVSGKAYGFATGTTGGGAAAAVYPKDIAELTTLLKDNVARTIVLNKEYVLLSKYII